MTWTPNRIVLISHGRYDEAVADADCYPGQLLQINSNGNVQAHSVLGGGGPTVVATEDAMRGGTVLTKLDSGNSLPMYYPSKGDKFLMLLKAGQNVLKGAALMSAGDGSLTASPTAALATTLYQILAASTNITNTNVETAFSNGSYTIPANFLVAGDVLHIRGKAVVSAQNSTNTHDVKVYVGSTALADCGASALAAGNFAEFDITMTIRSLGATGKFVADVVTVVNPAGSATETTATIASTTIDTTVTEVIAVKSTASATSAGNVIALQEFQIDLQRAGGPNTMVYADEAIDNSGSTGTSLANAALIRCLIP